MCNLLLKWNNFLDFWHSLEFFRIKNQINKNSMALRSMMIQDWSSFRRVAYKRLWAQLLPGEAVPDAAFLDLWKSSFNRCDTTKCYLGLSYAEVFCVKEGETREYGDDMYQTLDAILYSLWHHISKLYKVNYRYERHWGKLPAVFVCYKTGKYWSLFLRYPVMFPSSWKSYYFDNVLIEILIYVPIYF